MLHQNYAANIKLTDCSSFWQSAKYQGKQKNVVAGCLSRTRSSNLNIGCQFLIVKENHAVKHSKRFVFLSTSTCQLSGQRPNSEFEIFYHQIFASWL